MDMQEKRELIDSIGQMMDTKLNTLRDELREEMKSSNEILREEIKLNSETLRDEIKLNSETLRVALHEEMKSNNEILREEMKSNNETLLRGVNMIVENKYDQILKLLREDYGRVAAEVEKIVDYSVVKATVDTNSAALEQHNQRITALEQKAVV